MAHSNGPAMPILRELADERTIFYPWTVEQYHALIKDGFLPEGEPYELLDGQMVRKDRSATGEDPMTVGHEHALVVKRLARLSPQLERLGCHVQTQQPVSLPPLDEPEPDAAIVLGTEEDYRDQHPSATQITCMIEVADSSLRRDRTAKLRIYAAAGIPCYIVINLPDRIVEVYTKAMAGRGRAARYGHAETFAMGQSVNLPAAAGRHLKLAVRNLLP